jgi:hypothetical protein
MNGPLFGRSVFDVGRVRERKMMRMAIINIIISGHIYSATNCGHILKICDDKETKKRGEKERKWSLWRSSERKNCEFPLSSAFPF